MIVKTGDDCRQELLAMQLIRALHDIFAEAQLPLWLRPYEASLPIGRTACHRGIQEQAAGVPARAGTLLPLRLVQARRG